MGDRNGAMALAFGMRRRAARARAHRQGRVVDVSLLATAMWTLSSDVLPRSAARAAADARAGAMPNPLVGLPTKDGRHIQLVFLEGDRYWPTSAACRPRGSAGRSALRRPRRRGGERRDCVAELDAMFAARTFGEWKALLPGSTRRGRRSRRSRSCSTTRRYRQRLRRRGDADDGTLPAAHVPVQFDGQPAAVARAPEHGEHTEPILTSSATTGTRSSRSRSRGDPVTAPSSARAGARTRRVSAPYWAAAADHVLTVARARRAARSAIPPDVVCPHCRTTDAGLRVHTGERPWRGAVVDGRAPVVPARLRRYLPFVLVDVELDEQPGLRFIGRLLDGPDAPLPSVRARRRRVRGHRRRGRRPRVRVGGPT